MPRTIAIGDIHGCLKELNNLIDLIKIKKDDTIVTLGDYIDRGPNPKGVVDRLIELADECNLITLMGNHEEMMLDESRGKKSLSNWSWYCDSTMESYKCGDPSKFFYSLPNHHAQFFENLLPYYETESHIFVHGCYDRNIPIAETSSEIYLWDRPEIPPKRHRSGKTVIVGHTPVKEIKDYDCLIMIDTGCFYNSVLTAIDVDSKEIWQTKK